MSSIVRLGMAFLLIAAAPAPSEAQSDGSSPPDARRVSGALFLGLGNGPSPLAEYGARVLYEPLRTVGAYADVRRLQAGFGVACIQSWPESYACSMRAISVNVGMAFEPLPGRSLSPVVEGGVGLLDRTDQVVEGGAAFAASVAAALRLQRGGPLSLKIFLRQAMVWDHGYEALMGERMNYRSWGLELEVRPKGHGPR